jgi:integrase
MQAGQKLDKGPVMAKLTQAALRSLIKKPGRHSDGGGLYFRVLNDAKAYFVYRYTVAGKERETSLGPFPELGLAEAREKHAELRKMVKVDRADPIAEKRAAKATDATPSAKPTFGMMADEYLRTHECVWRSPKHRYQWAQTLGHYCAAIRDLPVDEVKTADILGVLRPVWSKTPETGTRLRGRIEAVIDMARALGHIDADRANPARWKGHLDHLLPPAKKLGVRGHHAAMPYADLPAFMVRLAEIDTTASRALQFLILTCARTSEVLHMTWDEVSFGDAIWRVPSARMKMQKPHDVPLSEDALRLLGDQMGGRGKNPFVFPGKPRQSLSSMAMAMLMRRMGAGEFTVHGFRSAARSWMADQGIAFELAESALAHTVGNSVVQAYQRPSMLERRRPLMQSWSDFVTGPDTKVIALQGRVRAPIPRA